LRSIDAASAVSIPMSKPVSNSVGPNSLVVAAPYRRVDVGAGGCARAR